MRGARADQPCTTWSHVWMTSSPASSTARARLRSSAALASRIWNPKRNGRIPNTTLLDRRPVPTRADWSLYPGRARKVAEYYHPALRMDGTPLELDVSE